MPAEHHRLSAPQARGGTAELANDAWKLGTMRHHQSLVPLSQDARKPRFHLRSADHVISAHMDSFLRCREDFDWLATSILAKASESISG
jgi:chromosome partitioning protein